MKIFFDFLPAVIFFIFYKTTDIYRATFSLMMVTYLQIFWLWIKHKRIDFSYKMIGVLVTFFGSATLLLHDEIYIKWKPTVINWLFAIVFLGSTWIGEKSILERLLASKVELPKTIWKKLNWMWICFFIVIGTLNIYIAYQCSTDAWVNFKLFGVLGFTIIFSMLQGIYLAKYMQH